MEPLARVTPRIFAAIDNFAAKNDVRYYLNGICIQRNPAGGIVVVATDGHVFGAIDDPDGWIADGHNELIVARPTKRMVSAIKGKHKSLVPVDRLLIMKNCQVLACGEDVPPFDSASVFSDASEIIDAKFPDWRRVIPKRLVAGESEPEAAPPAAPYFGHTKLGQFVAAAEMLCEGKAGSSAYMHTETFGPSAGSIVRISTSTIEPGRFIGVIMPMRVDGVELTMPDWTKQEAAPAPIPAPAPEPVPEKPRYRFRGSKLVEAIAQPEAA